MGIEDYKDTQRQVRGFWGESSVGHSDAGFYKKKRVQGREGRLVRWGQENIIGVDQPWGGIGPVSGGPYNGSGDGYYTQLPGESGTNSGTGNSGTGGTGGAGGSGTGI